MIILVCLSSIAVAQKHQSKSLPAALTEDKKPKLSEIEKAVLDEVNTARREPQKYIEYLEIYKKSLHKNLLILPDGNRIVMTEGLTAINDALSDLKKMSPINLLTASNGLTAVASDQLKDLQENVTLGHKGKDGSLLDVRMLKFGTVGVNYAENISYGADKARDIVLAFIIDDGVKSRAHRKNIFSSDFNIFGVACGKEKRGEFLCVTEFADSFSEREKPLGTMRAF